MITNGEINQNKHFMNNYIGIPALPLLGKY